MALTTFSLISSASALFKMHVDLVRLQEYPFAVGLSVNYFEQGELMYQLETLERYAEQSYTSS